MKKQLYIAYGSNLNKRQMQYRCPDAELAGIGALPNYRLEFRRVLTVIHCPGSSVPVAVWKISRKDGQNLDIYEGWPHCYRKENLRVDFSDGTGCSAMAYVMNSGYLSPPSASYYKIVAQGYEDCSLDKRALFLALRASQKRVAPEIDRI